MFNTQRQHPVAALARSFEIIRANFFTILILLFVGNVGNEGSFTLYWIFGAFIILLIWGIISWLRFTFSADEGELKIEQGVFVHKKMYLTSDRIQVIDISAGVIQRMFGLVAVEVKTAGSGSKQAKIDALSREEAEQLKNLLRSNGDEAESEPKQESLSELYTLDTRDLLTAASTSGRMGVALSIVGGAFSQLDQVISEELMIQFVQTHMPRSTSASLIVSGILVAIIIAWLFSFLSTLITYYDFSVEVREDDLLITKGLFERKQLTIPFNRIQAVQIKEGLLRQPLGYASLVIESAGYGENEGNSNTLFPLIRKDRLNTFIEKVIPEYDVETNHQVQVGRLGLRRYLLQMVWISLPLIAFIWWTVPYGVFSWFILIPMLLLGYQQYRDAEVRSDDSTLVMTARLLSKTTAIIQKYRIQSAQVKQNPFQSRLDLADIIIHVASGNQGRSFKVRELTEEEAVDIKEWTAWNGNPIKKVDSDVSDE